VAVRSGRPNLLSSYALPQSAWRHPRRTLRVTAWCCGQQIAAVRSAERLMASTVKQRVSHAYCDVAVACNHELHADQRESVFFAVASFYSRQLTRFIIHHSFTPSANFHMVVCLQYIKKRREAACPGTPENAHRQCTQCGFRNFFLYDRTLSGHVCDFKVSVYSVLLTESLPQQGSPMSWVSE